MATALITGASSGIGAAFARSLAAQGYDLVLVARSEDRLAAIATDLQAQHNIAAQVIVQDLSLIGATGAVIAQVAAEQRTIDLLINNAGFADYGAFHTSELAKQSNMVQVNITAIVELTHHYLGEMRQRNRGGIINVASIAAFQPMPYWSTYGATKAFVLHFTEALWAENQDHNVKILALCPGPTESEFFQRANIPIPDPSGMTLVTPEEVVQEALAALKAREASRVTGNWLNHFISALPRFFPREAWVEYLGEQFQPKS
ncbi:MAG: SDR family NAD(P)-dependent oxidoreductase [Spirulinaceae cyanobacterium]